MRRWWWSVPLCVLLVAAAIYGVAILSAQPAPDHAFFARASPRPQVIAHRGGSHLRPENTLAAFSHAAEVGADVLEMDVRATADGAIVVLHDATVDRTTDGRGPVETFTLAELRKLDAGYRWSADGGRTYPFRGREIRVPTIDDVLGGFSALRMNIEMKPGDPALAQSLCSRIRKFSMTRKVLVASVSHDLLGEFRHACPEVATSMSAREARIFVGLARAYLPGVYSPAAVALQIPDRLGDAVIATPALVAAARGRNLKVHVWSVNDPDRMRELIALGVDGIITDRPDVLVHHFTRARR